MGRVDARLKELAIELPQPSRRHTRMAVGVSALPYDVAVEVEGVFEIRTPAQDQP